MRSGWGMLEWDDLKTSACDHLANHILPILQINQVGPIRPSPWRFSAWKRRSGPNSLESSLGPVACAVFFTEESSVQVSTSAGAGICELAMSCLDGQKAFDQC